MTEIVYYVASSIDGYIATPDGGVDWLTPFQSADEDHGFRELYSSVDLLLMGSRTYEFALGQPKWPSPDKPSWVFTTRPLKVAHPSVTLTSVDPSEAIDLMHARGFERAWLMGGGELAASFRARGLISHYVISIIPVVLGGGIQLFADATPQDSLKLLEAKSFQSGIVQLSYERGQTPKNPLERSAK